jgi:hypothetical protein
VFVNGRIVCTDGVDIEMTIRAAHEAAGATPAE